MTTVTLSRPIEHDGRKITVLEIDDPTVGAILAYEDARAGKKSENAATVAMLAHDLGIPEAVLHTLRSADYFKVVAALAPFAEATDGDGGLTPA